MATIVISVVMDGVLRMVGEKEQNKLGLRWAKLRTKLAK